MKLYFDIGNTNIKLNFVDNNHNDYVRFVTKFSYTVDSLWKEMPEILKKQQIKKVLISSVVPKLTSILEILVNKYWNISPWIIRNPMKIGVKLNVDDPKILGSDLVAISAYAAIWSDNTIIINLGTTTTIIHVKDKILNGVIIMLGLNLQLDSVLKNVAKISDLNIKFEDKNLGKNNEEALGIGIINSQVLAIKNHIKKIDQTANIIISGGNAKMVKNQLDYKYIKEITIEGMKVLEKLNEK